VPEGSRFDLTGRVALVTGASRGIGSAIASALAEQGAQVVLSSRKQSDLDEEAARINALYPDRATAIAAHAGRPEDLERLVKSVMERHSHIDILVNNAATNPHYGPIHETDLSAFQKTVDVNIRGYFFMSSLGTRLMAKNGGGSIINVASINAVVPGRWQGIYSITKAAIVSMTKAFAKECASMGVRVNALLPGATDTKFAATLIHSTDPVVRAHLVDRVPMQRAAQPDEMAGAVLYLASNAASYTTGSCLVVDGGYLSA
jgi:NAD(P)-dependent dehydrogenase (short-subunit alcohol dehydrogenase family)